MRSRQCVSCSLPLPSPAQLRPVRPKGGRSEVPISLIPVCDLRRNSSNLPIKAPRGADLQLCLLPAGSRVAPSTQTDRLSPRNPMHPVRIRPLSCVSIPANLQKTRASFLCAAPAALAMLYHRPSSQPLTAGRSRRAQPDANKTCAWICGTTRAFAELSAGIRRNCRMT